MSIKGFIWGTLKALAVAYALLLGSVFVRDNILYHMASFELLKQQAEDGEVNAPETVQRI